ncbi:MAG TPA: hypothetical protein VK206_04175 [Anaerolineales bacterium]|nr:hypothetical protein [Anaerolineales bacterium]
MKTIDKSERRLTTACSPALAPGASVPSHSATLRGRPLLGAPSAMAGGARECGKSGRCGYEIKLKEINQGYDKS